jgi:hypothetical protein
LYFATYSLSIGSLSYTLVITAASMSSSTIVYASIVHVAAPRSVSRSTSAAATTAPSVRAHSTGYANCTNSEDADDADRRVVAEPSVHFSVRWSKRATRRAPSGSTHVARSTGLLVRDHAAYRPLFAATTRMASAFLS